MADYNDISLLSQLDSTTPAGGEQAHLLPAALRQVKQFLTVYLAEALADNGQLKASAVGETMIGDGAVTTAKIADLAVTTAKLADLAVTTLKIVDAAITAVKLAPDSVTTAKIVDGAVTAAKLAVGAIGAGSIADLAVTTLKIADLAVTTEKLADGSVTAAKLGDAQVTLGKLGLTSTDVLLFRDGATLKEVAIGGALRYAGVDPGTPEVLKFSLASGGSTDLSIRHAVVQEKRSSGTAAGASTAGWNTVRTGWSVSQDPGQNIAVNGASIRFLEQGAYLIRITVPAYSVGSHRAKVRRMTDPALDLLLGTTESAPPGVTTRSLIEGIIQADENEEIQVHQWAELSVAVNGQGLPVGSGEEEVYTTLEILKV